MLANGAHCQIGDFYYYLDESYEDLTNRRPYIHGGRSIFAEQFSPTGVPGAQNLRQENMHWHLTNFDGEGQVVLDADDPDSARRFYKSEGLDMRTPGQFKLNKSSVAQTPAISGAASTTYQGAADMADVSGTASTTAGTDRFLTAVNTYIATSSSFSQASGATNNVQVDYYLYRSPYADAATTINGSALKLDSGDGAADGTTFVLKSLASARSGALATGTAFSATTNIRVEFRAHIGGAAGHVFESASFRIVDTTADKVIDQQNAHVRGTSAPTPPTAVLQFNPTAGHTYKFFVIRKEAGGDRRLIIDSIKYGPQVSDNSAFIEVWDQTGGATFKSRTFAVTSESSGQLTGSLVFAAATGNNYRFRVRRAAGKQQIVVDKITVTNQSGTPWTLDCLEVGLGGRVWLGAHAAGVDTRVWRTAPAGDSLGTDSLATLNDGAATTNATVRAMTHSDNKEYIALSTGDIYSVTGAAADDLHVTGLNDLVGITVCQNRLFSMEEGSAGVTIKTWPLDTAGAVSVLGTDVVPAGSKTADTLLRQRICSTPTGARFFVNYGDATAKVFETDSSLTTLATRELADLGHGVKATAIAYEAGITFVTGQYAADSGSTPQSALWIIDANGVLERIGFFRFDSPTDVAPNFIVPYQQDIYILQGRYVWRYSLVRGGLFLEYEHGTQTPGNSRALAILQGRTYALYSDDLWLTGSWGYRQSSRVDGGQFVSSVYDWGLPGIQKTLVKVQVLTDTLPSNTQVMVEYQKDQDGTWTQLGVASSGTTNTFIASNALSPAAFTTLQIRATPASADGLSTPVVKSIIVTAQASEQDEYFDVVLLCEDEDSSFRIDGQQIRGEDKAAALASLWRSGVPINFVDGFSSKLAGVATPYLATVEQFRDERNAEGEGRVFASLKVVK